MAPGGARAPRGLVGFGEIIGSLLGKHVDQEGCLGAILVGLGRGAAAAAIGDDQLVDRTALWSLPT